MAWPQPTQAVAQAKLEVLGGEPGNLSPEQFARMNRQDCEKFGVLTKQVNTKRA